MEIFTSFANSKVLWDFFSREGGIFIFVVGGYLLANRANQFLDQVEHELYLEKKKKDK